MHSNDDLNAKQALFFSIFDKYLQLRYNILKKKIINRRQTRMSTKNRSQIKHELKTYFSEMNKNIKNNLKKQGFTEEILDKNSIGLIKNVRDKEVKEMKLKNKKRYSLFKKAGFIKNDSLIIKNKLLCPMWKEDKLVYWQAIDPKDKNNTREKSFDEIIANSGKLTKVFLVGNIIDFYRADSLGLNVCHGVKSESEAIKNLEFKDKPIFFGSDTEEALKISELLWPQNEVLNYLFSDRQELITLFDKSKNKKEFKENLEELNSTTAFEYHLEHLLKIEDGFEKNQYLKDTLIPLISKTKGINRDHYLKILSDKTQYSKSALKLEIKDHVSNSKNTTKLFKKIKKELTLFTDERGGAYAKAKYDGHFKTYSLEKDDFKNWLKIKLQKLMGDNVPDSSLITNCKNQLIAHANLEGETYTLSNRVAKKDGDFWYDLADTQHRAVKTTENGWKIINKTPILFRRSSNSNPQIVPSKTGDPCKLLDYINISDEKSKVLLMVYLISLFVPDIPHAILILYGAEGSAKSTLLEFIREIVDPSRVPLLTLPKNEKGLMGVLDRNYCGFFDNISRLSQTHSDHFCRATTGAGLEFRKLYTDNDTIIRNYKRCIAFNGLDRVATQPDLLDRSIVLKLKRISDDKRQEISVMKRDFKDSLPSILGGIFTVLSKAKKIYPEISLKKKPRMADFFKWGYAIAEALEGTSGKEFARLFYENEREKTKYNLVDNPFAVAIDGFINKRKKWSGTAEELLEEIHTFAKEEGINSKHKKFPSTAVWITRRLNEISTTLSKIGINYDNCHNKKKLITLKKEFETGSKSALKVI